MIELINVSKSFNEYRILNEINLSLPSRGLIALLGDSGSGKSTLIKIIAGLLKQDSGSVRVNGTIFDKLNDEQLAKFRLENIGVVFQNFNLLNSDNVYNNISLALDSLNEIKSKEKKARIKRLLKEFNLVNFQKRIVNTLSGGERQRVAIARAIINQPLILLCDEPTGSLDQKMSLEIYHLLKKISKKTLVVVATHDVDNVLNIADQIIKIEDGNIKIQAAKPNDVILRSRQKRFKKSKLPLSFIFRHIRQNFKSKKYRTLITNSVLAISLLGIGLTTILTSNLANKMEVVFSSLVDSNQIIMQRKNSPNELGDVYSASKEEVMKVENKYQNYIDYIGVTYLVNFENFFKDANDFSLRGGPISFEIPSLSVRKINDFIFYDKDSVNRYYPRQELNLANDEVVLGLTYEEMSNLCYQLHIGRTFIDLGNYLENNVLTLTLNLANQDWSYDDEQIFIVKAITEVKASVFYHTNQLWNEFVFEDLMFLPSIDNEDKTYPWEMYKAYFIVPLIESSSFLDMLMLDNDFKDLLFERTSYLYHPNLCKIGEICNEKRLIVFSLNQFGIDILDFNLLLKEFPELENYYFTSQYGYAPYITSLMNGFMKSFYVSSNYEQIEKVIDLDSKVSLESNTLIDLPSNVVAGNYLYSLNGGLSFSSNFNQLIKGRTPLNNNEIIISSALEKYLYQEENVLGKHLYVGALQSETIENNNMINKNYATKELIIVGVIDCSQNRLYHHNHWTISFFRDEIGVSSFNLIPNGVIFDLANDVEINPLLTRMQHNFNRYEFSSPFLMINESIDSITSYFEIILIIFSFVSSLISLFLLIIIVYLNIIEAKNEIMSLRQIGLSKNNIANLFITQTFAYGLVSFFISSISSIICDYFISLAINSLLGVSSPYIFSPLPIFIMFIFMCLITLIIPSLITRLFLRKI